MPKSKRKKPVDTRPPEDAMSFAIHEDGDLYVYGWDGSMIHVRREDIHHLVACAQAAEKK